MLNSHKKTTQSTTSSKKNNHEVPSHHFLCNEESITFTEKFDEKSNNFGIISDSIVIANMFAISGRNPVNIPKKLALIICAGFQNSKAKKGISGNHIIKRGHLAPFNKLYKKTDPWQVLVCTTKQFFSPINNIGKNNQVAIAWAPEECAFVLVIDTGTTLGLHRHILCTFYFHRNSLLMLGTLYTVPENTAKLITNGSERYIPVPLNSLASQNVLYKKVKKWQVKNTQSTQAVSLTNENPITSEKNDNTYSQLTQQFSISSIEDFDPSIFTETSSYGELICSSVVEVDMEDNEFTSSIIFNINKYCKDIIDMINNDVATVNDYQKKCLGRIDSLLNFKKEIEFFKTNLAKATIENPDELADYFTNESTRLTIRLGEFINGTDNLMYEVYETSHRKHKEIYEKLMALQNKFFSYRLNDQMKERWDVLNKSNDKYEQTHKMLLKIHDDADNQLILCVCSLLRPMSSFLCEVIKNNINPTMHPAFIKLIIKNGTDEWVEKICKEMDNTKLFNFFKAKFDSFFTLYPEIFYSIIQNHSISSPNKK